MNSLLHLGCQSGQKSIMIGRQMWWHASTSSPTVAAKQEPIARKSAGWERGRCGCLHATGRKDMEPDLELVQIRPGESFAAWSHGYPFRTVRWHFHPEYELHMVAATTGRYFVGDFIGDFAPGNLVLTGPNLPHNWVSDVPPGAKVPLRGRVLQFTEQFVRDATALLPELSSFLPVLELSRRGALFSPQTSERVGPMLADLVGATGIRRIELFMSIIGTLSRAQGIRALASAGYHPD